MTSANSAVCTTMICKTRETLLQKIRKIRSLNKTDGFFNYVEHENNFMQA